MDTPSSSVVATVVLQSIIGTFAYLAFEKFSGQKEIYFNRVFNKSDRCPPLPSGNFGWLFQTLQVSDEDTLRMVGLDSYVFLRFLKLCFRVFLFSGIFGCIVLLPIYGTPPTAGIRFGIETLTMANIPQGGDRLWASLFAVYVFTILFLYLFHKEYEYFVTLRQEYFATGDADEHPLIKYSVFLENIPEKFRSQKVILDLFKTVFPNEVAKCSILINMAPLAAACTERKVIIANLENAIAAYNGSDQKEQPQISVKDKITALCGGKVIIANLESAVAAYNGSGQKEQPQIRVKDGISAVCGGKKTDAIPFLLEELKSINDKIEKLREEAGRIDKLANSSDGVCDGSDDGDSKFIDNAVVAFDAPSPRLDVVCQRKEESTNEDTLAVSDPNESFSTASVTGVALVTLKSRVCVSMACQMPYLFSMIPSMQVSPAPQAHTVLWKNIDVSPDYTKRATIGTSAILYAGLVFWAVILALVAAISSLSNLEKYLPFLKQLHPVLYAILQGQLPVIALVVSISLLPVIFTAVATRIEKRKTFIDIRFQVMHWYFGYQIVNVYLLLFGGSIFGALSDAIADPSSVIALLASSLPGVSTFFINLMLSLLLSGVPLQLLNIAPVITYKLYRTMFPEKKLTARKLLEGPLAPVDMDFSLVIPDKMYILCISIIYWVIAPIVGLVAGMLFFAWYVVYKFQLLYYIRPAMNTGGLYFYKLYDYSMTGLLMSTFTMIGYLGLKEGAAQMPLLIPLVFVIIFVKKYTKSKFEVISNNMALDLAMKANASSKDVKDWKEPFFFDPVMVGPIRQGPFPYRIDDVPLFDESGAIHANYRLASLLCEEKHSVSDMEFGKENGTQRNKVRGNKVQPMEIIKNSNLKTK